MRRGPRICNVPGCPELTTHTSGRCDTHRRQRYREADARRPSSTRRGYGVRHQRLREQWCPKVEAGLVNCARCGEPIQPGEAWDLGHDDVDRTRYTGPEHERCNRATHGREQTSRVDDEPRRYFVGSIDLN